MRSMRRRSRWRRRSDACCCLSWTPPYRGVGSPRPSDRRADRRRRSGRAGLRLWLRPLVLPRESPHALGPIGHEFIGVVEEVGAEVRGIGVGELVIAPFTYSDGTCAHCRAGWTSNCAAGGGFGNHGIDGGQGEAVRVPFAASTLVQVPSSDHSAETMRSLLTLSDVMCTGHHAAVSAGIRPGSVVAVVGDGAV